MDNPKVGQEVEGTGGTQLEITKVNIPEKKFDLKFQKSGSDIQNRPFKELVKVDTPKGPKVVWNHE